MNRRALEHIVRAAAANVDLQDIVIVGSQSILGAYPNAPPELLISNEADVFPRFAPDRAIVIEGSIGELSLFHSTFGYYAHGVDEATAVLPDGWEERLIKIETPATMGAIGWCLEPHDLAVSKLAAAREKDFAFVRTMLNQKMIATGLLSERLNNTPRISLEVKRLACATFGLS